MPANVGEAGNAGSIPGLGRSSGVGNGNPLQCSCLENSMDRGIWWATVHGVTQSQSQLSTHSYSHSVKTVLKISNFALVPGWWRVVGYSLVMLGSGSEPPLRQPLDHKGKRLVYLQPFYNHKMVLFFTFCTVFSNLHVLFNSFFKIKWALC